MKSIPFHCDSRLFFLRTKLGINMSLALYLKSKLNQLWSHLSHSFVKLFIKASIYLRRERISRHQPSLRLIVASSFKLSPHSEPDRADDLLQPSLSCDKNWGTMGHRLFLLVLYYFFSHSCKSPLIIVWAILNSWGCDNPHSPTPETFSLQQETVTYVRRSLEEWKEREAFGFLVSYQNQGISDRHAVQIWNYMPRNFGVTIALASRLCDIAGPSQLPV